MHYKVSGQLEEQVWPVKALGWLLLLQAAVLLGSGIFHLITVNFLTSFKLLLTLLSTPEVLNSLYLRTFFSIILIPLALLVSIAAIGFWRAWLTAWLYAMIGQGLILAISLALYFYGQPDYLAMVSSTFLVLYLNYADGQANLQVKSVKAEEEGLE